MKRLLFFTLLLALLCAAKCSSNRTEAYQLGEPIRLTFGAQALSPHTAMQFTSVKEDSRCPKYTNCMWDGQVVVQLSLGERNRQLVDLALRSDKPEAAQSAIDGYLYRLKEVAPYPEAGENIDIEDYVITVVVEAI